MNQELIANMQDRKDYIYFLCTVLYGLYQLAALPAFMTVLKVILDFECDSEVMFAVYAFEGQGSKEKQREVQMHRSGEAPTG